MDWFYWTVFGGLMLSVIGIHFISRRAQRKIIMAAYYSAKKPQLLTVDLLGLVVAYSAGLALFVNYGSKHNLSYFVIYGLFGAFNWWGETRRVSKAGLDAPGIRTKLALFCIPLESVNSLFYIVSFLNLLMVGKFGSAQLIGPGLLVIANLVSAWVLRTSVEIEAIEDQKQTPTV